jgi:hypothetical protein
MKDSLWSIDLFRCESATWYFVVTINQGRGRFLRAW